jgi:signal transduction histidine kinase/CheY-like chemotaxis protein
MVLFRPKLNTPRHKITWTYVLALAVVAGLSIATHLILGMVISDQQEVAQIVNRTGRQRMLSQRVAWLAPHYAQTGNPATRALLTETINEMENAARQLRTGETEKGHIVPLPNSIQAIYTAEDVTRRVSEYLTHARAVAATDIPAGTHARGGPVLDHLNAIMSEASGPILNTLDNIVSQYVRESDARIARLQNGQNITLLIVILTLTAEALFIFRPLASGLISYVDRVKELTRRASDAQRASDAKSSFLANMSHELRTPMTGIIGMSDLLLNSAQSPEQEKVTRLLRQSAQNLQELLNDILDLAKIEAGGMVVESVDFRLSELLNSVRELYDYAMQRKGLKFTFETTVAHGDVFHGDPKHMRQVLCNLVGNALKFTDSGVVRVKTSQELLEDGSSILKFSVIDSGIGIAEENIPRLFAKFEQEDTSTARRFGGTGLGLAICKQLVEAMDGAIEVESVKGKGSTFSFSVKVGTGDPQNISADHAGVSLQGSLNPEQNTLKILLADDNPTTQFLVMEVLSFWGHEVVTADNGREAIERVQAMNFDIVIVDMQMPEMNGEEAARWIRANGGVSATIPIIALTADAILDNRKRYIAAGCNAVVTKPISWDELARQISTLSAASKKPSEAARRLMTAP